MAGALSHVKRNDHDEHVRIKAEPAAIQCAELLVSIRNESRSLAGLGDNGIQAAQDEIDAAVERIAATIRENAEGPKEHFDIKKWREKLPDLSDQAIKMLMEWRQANMKTLPPEQFKFPQCEVDDEIGPDGKPTGKLIILKIL